MCCILAMKNTNIIYYYFCRENKLSAVHPKNNANEVGINICFSQALNRYQMRLDIV